ncbi:MAG: acetoacetate--CoA ligase [Candidatus Hodarchaeales archaeon]|jgi:acetoacetyl-CoA synthetase
MGKLLWKPSEDQIEQANATKFIKFVNRKFNLSIGSYHQLHEWSVEKISDFWATMWEFGEVIASRRYNEVVEDLSVFPGTKWFPGARLNYAENLLRYRDEQLAFIFKGETEKSANLTHADLYVKVARLARSLREIGVSLGDRIVAYMPNLIETVIAMLATTSIGATWASCGAELGSKAVLDRLGQVEPKVLFTADGYYYKGKKFDSLKNVEKIVKGIPSLEKVIVVSYIEEKTNLSNIPASVHYDEFLSPEKGLEIRFEQVPADQPLYIMFSSGTTGKPKSMVQGVAGILLNQLKDLIIHTDLKRGDRFNYLTTASWMMWNFLVGSLAVGSTILLYDGNPSYPDWRTIWKIIQDERLTIFGCGASYVYYLRNVGAKPGKDFDLSSLRQISQTGSPLSADGFEWVYKNIKDDLLFNSITGGTDLNGTFGSGTPALPVYAGQIQAPALGMKVKAYDEKGSPIFDREGELVCEAPFPSQPLHFWNDPNDEKYLKAYFNHYKPMGKNVWRHGDYMVIHSETGGITMYGRSDALLKPSGVRIGTAEIYNVVEDLIVEVVDSLAIGQSWKDDQRIILFVKLVPDYRLTRELKEKIRKELRQKASPRHVPALIYETPDIPYTFSGKKVEIAVMNILHGRPITNRGALANPESLDYYEEFAKQLQNE